MPLDEVARVIARFPGVTEGTSYGNRAWFVGKRHFAWERPFSKADVKRFGGEPVPDGPILALRLADLNDRDAVLAAGHDGVFTIEHLDGYPALLVQLKRVTAAMVRELIEDAWLAAAPADLANEYLRS